MRAFAVNDGKRRLSMVTDSINEGSLFGGVATALIFSALLARQTGRTLRIITRTQSPAAENVGTIFRAHGITWDDNIEFEFADLHDDSISVPINDDEFFITTSWWTTEQARQTIAQDKIIYVLQEDERMFYPLGDDHLKCEEVISDKSIQKVINSRLLYDHLKSDGVIDDTSLHFEPSFPDNIYFPEKNPSSSKLNFFFYARPINLRNLYERGVSVIEAAIERGILDPSQWNIFFVGKDLNPITLAGGFEPILVQNLKWDDYAKLVRSVDLGLTLMYTPHPSYPPLDIAASGGVAVTNKFGLKQDLTNYSKAIICVESDRESLLEGVRKGVEHASDAAFRRKALAESGILRNWSDSFGPVFEQLKHIDRLWFTPAEDYTSKDTM